MFHLLKINMLFYIFWGLEKHALFLTDLGHLSKKLSIPREPGQWGMLPFPVFVVWAHILPVIISSLPSSFLGRKGVGLGWSSAWFKAISKEYFPSLMTDILTVFILQGMAPQSAPPWQWQGMQRLQSSSHKVLVLSNAPRCKGKVCFEARVAMLAKQGGVWAQEEEIWSSQLRDLVVLSLFKASKIFDRPCALFVTDSSDLPASQCLLCVHITAPRRILQGAQPHSHYRALPSLSGKILPYHLLQCIQILVWGKTEQWNSSPFLLCMYFFGGDVEFQHLSVFVVDLNFK